MSNLDENSDPEGSKAQKRKTFREKRRTTVHNSVLKDASGSHNVDDILVLTEAFFSTGASSLFIPLKTEKKTKEMTDSIAITVYIPEQGAKKNITLETDEITVSQIISQSIDHINPDDKPTFGLWKYSESVGNGENENPEAVAGLWLDDKMSVKDCGIKNQDFLVLRRIGTSTEPSSREEPSNNPGTQEDSPKQQISTLPQKSNSQKDSQMEIIFDDDDSSVVKAGALPGLMQHLVSQKYDSAFVTIFIITYESFTTSADFLSMLFELFEKSPPVLWSNSLQSQSNPASSFLVDNNQLTKVRICNILKKWIELMYETIEEDTLVRLNQFVDSLEAANSKDPLAKMLRDSVNKKLISAKNPKRVFDEEAPTPKVPRNLNSPNLNFLDVDNEELARQLTLIDFEIFRSIKPTELLLQSWNKPELHCRSPMVLKHIDRFNDVSSWVASMVVKVEDRVQRARMLSKIISIAMHLRQLNNFSTLFAFVAGLSNPSIARLAATKRELQQKSIDDLNLLEEFVSPESNFKMYRGMLKELALNSCQSPTIPYIGLYLKDLTFIEDGNPDFVGNNLINFEKRNLVSRVILEIMRYQQRPYNLLVVPRIRSFLKNLPRKPDKELFKLSLLREPREKT